MVLCKSPVSLSILVLTVNILVTHAVWELDRSNFEKFRQTASFPIFFVDSPSCSRCRLLYPFFYAASQVFVEDREIFFGRVQDRSLIRQWGIEELPVILYYEKGETEWERLEGDITVDNIVDTIAHALPGYIGDIKLHHVIEVTNNNYDELVVTPKQNVLLLTYNSDERQIRKSFEGVAVAFRFDEQVTFCALDVDKYQQVMKDRFGHRGIPAVFWYAENNKYNKFLFGGKLHPKTLLQFVNEKTHLWRMRDGTLDPSSGRIEKLDNIFMKNIPDIAEADAHSISKIISEMRNIDVEHSWETDFAEYYSEMLEKIAELGEPLGTLEKERGDIGEMLKADDLDLTQKQMDYFLRKQNILAMMISSLSEYEQRLRREEEERRQALKNAKPVIRLRRKHEL